MHASQAGVPVFTVQEPASTPFPGHCGWVVA